MSESLDDVEGERAGKTPPITVYVPGRTQMAHTRVEGRKVSLGNGIITEHWKGRTIRR
jgi:hypothetical protein